MSNLTQPIVVQEGLYTIDRSVIPYIRSKFVEFRAHDLKPLSNCSFWFDTANVTQFIQPASVLVTNTGSYANIFHKGEGLYCKNTHAFATVIDTSMSNTIYINEDYVSLNLTAYGSGNTFSSANYNVGDLVYLSTNSPNVYANTFTGKVIYWNATDASLHLKPLNGTPNTTTLSSGLNNILYKVGTNQIANVTTIVLGAKFPVNGNVYATDNVSNGFYVSSYTHNHGVFAQTSPNTSNVLIQSNVSACCAGQTFFVVSGAGIGQISTIVSAANNLLVVNPPVSNPLFVTGATGIAGYAIGNSVVDQIGHVAGVFAIPEDGNFGFPAGNRLFTINDATTYPNAAFNSASATMRGTAIYAAAGQISPSNTNNQTPVVDQTPILPASANGTILPSGPTFAQQTISGSNNPVASPNPLAQMFTIPAPNTAKQSYGIFATSVDLFFANAPSGSSTQFPVTVMIMSTENGIPTSDILASATVEFSNIKVTPGANVTGNATAVYPSTSNTSCNTRFEFPDPVFLAPGVTYALAVYTETPDYLLWTSSVGETQANSNSLVSIVPFVGSLYMPQNSSVWTPINGQMLMFVLNKAQFSVGVPTTLTFQANATIQDVMMDLSVLASSDLTFPVANLNYSMLTTIANTDTQDASFFSVNPNQVYNYGSDLKTSSINSARRRVVRAGNANSTQIQITMFTEDPDVSPMFNSERLGLVTITNLINNGSISNNNISITAPGNHINANNIVVTIGAPTGSGGIQATANVLPSGLSGNSLVAINITNIGAGYIVSPSITISEAAAPSNATAVIYGEDQKFGGNALTRYITRTITLANGFAAGDLSVVINCIRPYGTDIQCYYKVLGVADNDVISNKTWQPMFKTLPNLYSPDDKTPITLQFESGTGTGTISYVYNGVTYPLGGTFGAFQIKLTMLANDPTVVPFINNFYAIAIPGG